VKGGKERERRIVSQGPDSGCAMLLTFWFFFLGRGVVNGAQASATNKDEGG
jgi:hypothetical protein